MNRQIRLLAAVVGALIVMGKGAIGGEEAVSGGPSQSDGSASGVPAERNAANPAALQPQPSEATVPPTSKGDLLVIVPVHGRSDSARETEGPSFSTSAAGAGSPKAQTDSREPDADTVHEPGVVILVPGGGTEKAADGDHPAALPERPAPSFAAGAECAKAPAGTGRAEMTLGDQSSVASGSALAARQLVDCR